MSILPMWAGKLPYPGRNSCSGLFIFPARAVLKKYGYYVILMMKFKFMEINLATLAIQNPWWSIDWRGKSKKPGTGNGFDPVLLEFDESAIKWQPSLIDELEFGKDRVYFLQGPPSVGKTTIIKLLVRKLVADRKIEADNIFYYACGSFYTFEQLNEAIKVFINWRRKQDAKERLFIFIDDIEYIKNWDNGIKHLHEAGLFKDTTAFISGYLFNHKIINNGFIINKTINPLDFADFIGLINPKLSVLDSNHYKNFSRQLDYYSDIYFLTGGYIGAINSYKEQGAVSQALYDNYLSWLMHDIARLGRDVTLLKQVIEQLLDNLGQPVGYQTIAKKTKARTHLTIAGYLDILESMSFVKTVYQTGNGEQPASRKAKKIYFSDPFIFALVYSFAQGSLNYWQFARERMHEDVFYAQLVENTVLDHLLRIAPRADAIFYWRDNIKKLQIDFVVKTGKKFIPILIRYNGEIGAAETNIFQAAGYKRGIIISRDQLKLDSDFKIVPLNYFLLFYRELIK
jgi:predicted AAA+ superfamily ATPase